LKIVFLSACYSEYLAKKIKKYVPNAIVLATFSKLPVLDESGRIFAAHFYGKLVQG
jgi:hypothetical protein